MVARYSEREIFSKLCVFIGHKICGLDFADSAKAAGATAALINRWLVKYQGTLWNEALRSMHCEYNGRLLPLQVALIPSYRFPVAASAAGTGMTDKAIARRIAELDASATCMPGGVYDYHQAQRAAFRAIEGRFSEMQSSIRKPLRRGHLMAAKSLLTIDLDTERALISNGRSEEAAQYLPHAEGLLMNKSPRSNLDELHLAGLRAAMEHRRLHAGVTGGIRFVRAGAAEGRGI